MLDRALNVSSYRRRDVRLERGAAVGHMLSEKG